MEHGADRVLFRLTDCEETLQVYPFAFTLDAEYRLDGMTLRQTVTVTNRGDTDMPFSFGFHTAFAWPLPGGAAKDDHRIVFALPEPGPIRRIGKDGLLLAAAEPTPVVARYLHLTDTLFADDALIWDRLESRALTFDGGRAALDIAFPDSPMLGIWQKPGAPFLAIEPWHGINDPADFSGEIEDKPGIILLPPGEACGFRMDVTVRPG